jgi:Domain of unknown function (DUF4388)
VLDQTNRETHEHHPLPSEAKATMTQQLQGALDEGVLANLLQYFAATNATGCLSVHSTIKGTGKVYVNKGRPVHAHQGSLIGVQAVASMLMLIGEFEFEGDVSTSKRSIETTMEAMLLSATLELDDVVLTPRTLVETEGNTKNSTGKLSPQAILKSVIQPDFNEDIEMPLSAIWLLPLINGRDSLEDIAKKEGRSLEVTIRSAEVLTRLRIALQAEPEQRWVPEAFVIDLVGQLNFLLGPVGEVMVQDALDDLEMPFGKLPENIVPKLLKQLFNQLEGSEQRQKFTLMARKLRDTHGADRIKPGEQT